MWPNVEIIHTFLMGCGIIIQDIEVKQRSKNRFKSSLDITWKIVSTEYESFRTNPGTLRHYVNVSWDSETG